MRCLHAVDTLNQQQYNINQVVKHNRQLLIQNHDQNVKKAKYNNVVKNATTTEYIDARNHYKDTIKESMIGKLEIPSLKINLPIFAGMSDNALLNGVGTFSKKRVMGQGNYVMLAHNLPNQYKNSLLEPLKNIKQNAKIKITDFNNVYVYRANFKRVVGKNNINLLGQTSKSMVTLFRCVGESGSSNRLVVQGKLVSTKPYGHYKQLNKKPKKMMKIIQPSGFDKFSIDTANALYFTGTFSKDWLQYLIACLPALVVILILVFKAIRVNRKK